MDTYWKKQGKENLMGKLTVLLDDKFIVLD